MSKGIKNILAAIFIIGACSIIEPNCMNLINTRVYAEEKPYLKDLYISDSTKIDFSKSTYSYIVDVDKDVDKILIKAKPTDASYIVRINGQEVTEHDKYKEDLSLDNGKNKIEIEVEDKKTNSTLTYVVYVYRGGKDTVYLKDINIDDNPIGFDKSNNFYNIELDKGTNVVDLETVPEEGTYSISFTSNGQKIENRNSIKIKFNGIGIYKVDIGVKDEDTQRVGTYTLNIYLGTSVSPSASDTINQILKPNQWVIVNGRSRYNDSNGKYLKNTWFYDNKYKSYYYFDSRGNMETGWIEDEDNYYYLNSKGQMQKGWLFYNNQWYYLDLKGVMRTGWIEYNDKWYFLRTDGVMATDWIVSKDKWYYLNSSGIMKTGWMYYDKKWYYLNSNGAMETGWIKSDDEWYYLNSDGSMKSGEWLYNKGNWYYLNYFGNMRCGWLTKDDKQYYFDEDGTMRTSAKVIDGYTYEFNKDGSVNYD